MIFEPVSPNSTSCDAESPSTITPSGRVDSSTVSVYFSFSGTYSRHCPSALVTVSASKPLPSTLTVTSGTPFSSKVMTPPK